MTDQIAQSVFDSEPKQVEGKREGGVLGMWEFVLKGIKTPVSVRLYQVEGDKWIHYALSQFIKTPAQATKCGTGSIPWAGTERAALDKAVAGITIWYKGAVNEGMKPEDGWLIPNEAFWA
jgi:hypothetical protein